jgi:hypothetical protein
MLLILAGKGPWLMSSPLDGIDIDAFLEHVPQRRQFAQLATFAFSSSREVDVFFGREAADGEADRAVRQFVAAAQARSTYDGSSWPRCRPNRTTRPDP